VWHNGGNTVAWETRGGQRRYYTRSRKVGGKVLREYLGCGEEAELAAALDANRRQKRQKCREERRARGLRWAVASALLAQLDDAADQLATVALLCAGYHQHQHGDWRRRRDTGVGGARMEEGMDENFELNPMKGDDGAVGNVEQLLAHARAGDRTVLPQLQRALDADSSLWRRYGDLAGQAVAAWIDLLAGDDLLLREAVMRKLQALYGELCGPHPSALESLLVERVLTCWLQTAFADTSYAQARGSESTAPLRQELQRRQESAQKRLLAAVKQLALVRKLLGPGLGTPASPPTAPGVSVLRLVAE
jgi:hypothetical protein